MLMNCCSAACEAPPKAIAALAASAAVMDHTISRFM
jgi:hypothetical protein